MFLITSAGINNTAQKDNEGRYSRTSSLNHLHTSALCFPSSKLEKVLNSGSESDAQLKYLTGEWFYEAKSRRHMDKIHGSEIILASMRQKRAGSGVFTLHTVDKGLV